MNEGIDSSQTLPDAGSTPEKVTLDPEFLAEIEADLEWARMSKIGNGAEGSRHDPRTPRELISDDKVQRIYDALLEGEKARDKEMAEERAKMADFCAKVVIR